MTALRPSVARIVSAVPIFTVASTPPYVPRERARPCRAAALQKYIYLGSSQCNRSGRLLEILISHDSVHLQSYLPGTWKLGRWNHLPIYERSGPTHLGAEKSPTAAPPASHRVSLKPRSIDAKTRPASSCVASPFKPDNTHAFIAVICF